MRAGTSVYLDVARFAAALVVFLSHASRDWATADLFPLCRIYGETAVMVFFIISGFVIGDVAARSSPRRYVVDRLTRLYSVALPALAITLLATVAVAVAGAPMLPPDFGVVPSVEAVRMFAASLFANRVWNLGLEPALNVPWWSISYEFFYYAIFFGYVYIGRRRARLLYLLSVAVLAGPAILALLPLWMLGWGLQRLCVSDRLRIGMPMALALLLAGVAMMALAPKVGWHLRVDLHDLVRSTILADYVGGIGFALTVLAVNALSASTSPASAPSASAPSASTLPAAIRAALPRLAGAARWLAGLTFSLYLFHFPIIVAVCALYPGDPHDSLRRLTVIAVPALIVLAIGRQCERLRLPLRRLLLR